MQEPSWSELVELTEPRAVERHFDARNDRFLRPALAIAFAGAVVAAIAFPASGLPVAGLVWGAVLLGLGAVVAARRIGWFDRRPRAWLLGVLAALVLAVAAVLTGWFATKPLLIWLAISYAGLLAVDVGYARAHLGT
jgi:predicted membrane-bound spermidine synthase